MASVQTSTAAMLLAVVATSLALTPQARAVPVVPPGTSVLLDSGGWSWFEDERVVVDRTGERLYVSAVASEPAPGEVVLGEVDLRDGSRRVVSLGRAERLDDHDSAAIWEASTGEVLTAWSGHYEDRLVHTHLRGTDGRWSQLPDVVTDSLVTYNNLYAVPDGDGGTLLYDFHRGTDNDPEAMTSADGGRSWAHLGRVLRDPGDDANRPYVRYASRGVRIDLIATEGHPYEYDRPTSIYHGFLRDGMVHASDGTALGPVGSAVPVTSLTLVWRSPRGDDAWAVDVGYDPASGHPIAAFSTTRSLHDHRYHVGRWNSSAWRVRQIAHAGTALNPDPALDPERQERDYTGLLALDPRDAGHVVISTDADPTTGGPLVSATDGRRHHELFEGHRQPDDRYMWTPLTAHSTADNIRPVVATSLSGTWALAWLRGHYTTFDNYDTQVVGIVDTSAP